MTAFLDTPNESFSNVAAQVDTQTVVLVESSNNVVTNTGVLWATDNFAAVWFTDDSANGTLTNAATGYIRGGHTGVFVEADGATISNAGEIVGDLYGLTVDTTASSTVTVNNAFGGTIKGSVFGISFEAPGASEINNDGIVFGDSGIWLYAGTLTNSGEVGGSSYGIECQGDTTIVNANFGGIWSSGTAIKVEDGKATITNNADCLITGSQAAIRTDDDVLGARISLTNLGKIDGVINCDATLGNVNDTIVNKGTITDRVELGAGNDIFNGAGGISGEVYGEAGNDKLTGGAGDNALSGGAGLDILVGGFGRDELVGGTERDIFDFNSIKDSVRGSKRDFIADFQRGTDDIDLRTIDAKTGGGNQKFKFIGKQDFHDKKGELRYEDKGAKVIVQGDVNGDGKADFEILVKVGALSAGDFLL